MTRGMAAPVNNDRQAKLATVDPRLSRRSTATKTENKGNRQPDYAQ